MRIHVETLFTHDDNGRMISVNERSGMPAPRFFLGRTAQGNELRFRHDVSDELVHELTVACSSEPAGEEFVLPPYGSSKYEEVLSRMAPIQKVWAGPSYTFPRDLPVTSDIVRISQKNIDLLRPYFTDWLGDVEVVQPFLALVTGGRAVSVCGSVRITTVAHEAGVETHADFRGRGYAARVASAWAQAVRVDDRIPLYSTSWLNVASQAVAQKVGLIRYGTTLHIT